MVTRSRAREGREINVVPEVEFRPETETRHEVNKPAEIPCQLNTHNITYLLTYLTTCEEGLGATRPHVSDAASQYMTADKPETTAFTTILEMSPNFSIAPQTRSSASHTETV